MNANEFKKKNRKTREEKLPKLKTSLLKSVYDRLNTEACEIVLREPIVITTIRDKANGSYYTWLLLPEVIQEHIRINLVNNGFFVLFNYKEISVYWNKEKFEEEQNQ